MHLSSADAVPALRAARAAGVDLSVETCPHYLTFDAEDIADGATEFKCCPPIREAANREALWAALGRGDIDLVVSDHSPCTADAEARRPGDFGVAWGGIASLQLGLPAVWTGARARGHSLVDVVRWMADGARPTASGLTGQGPDRGRARRPTCACSPPTRTFVVDAAAAAAQEPRVRLRRAYARRHGPARPGCAAYRWTTTRPGDDCWCEEETA